MELKRILRIRCNCNYYYTSLMVFILTFSLCTFTMWDSFGYPSGKPCECTTETDCYCCGNLNDGCLFNRKLCTNVSYSPNQHELATKIIYDDKVLFNKGVSLSGEFLPICVHHTDLVEMKICLRLHSLNTHRKYFRGCAEFEITYSERKKEIKLCCFGNTKRKYIRNYWLFDTCGISLFDVHSYK